MDILKFEQYIERFNSADRGAFVDNLTADVIMQNGGMYLRGIEAVLRHYEHHIWPWFRETVHAERVVADERSLAVQMWTHFEALKDADTVFGAVQAGDQFDYRGVVMYEMDSAGKFSKILVSYLTFTATPLGGQERPLAIPH